MNINYAKLKTNLSLVIQRLKLLEKKKTELTQKSRKEIADYIQNGKYERAKIRVEHIIREDYIVEAMEIVEMYCDLLLARFGMIEHMPSLNGGLEEAVASLIWVAPRLQTDVKELKIIGDLLSMKYGKPFAKACQTNSMQTVNEKLMIKLGVQAPPKILVEKYLIEIAKSLNVHYEPDQEVLMEDEKYSNNSLNKNSDKSLLQDHSLIDLQGNDFIPLVPSLSQCVPPPLPSVPPAAYSVNKTKDGNEKVIGFNVLDPSIFSSNPSGSQSVPPAYDSVVKNDQSKKPPEVDVDNLNLPSVPQLPDIPSDDLDDPDDNAGGNSNDTKKGPDDFGFDDLCRRFNDLKKKK